MKRGNFWLAGLIFVWTAIALAYYYAFHRPFTPQFALRAALAARDLLCVMLLFAAAGAAGARLLPRLPAPPLARLAARAAAGLGALGLGYLLVGSLLSTAGWLAWALALGVLAWLRGELAEWWRDATDAARLWREGGPLGRALGALVAAIFACGLLFALAPPLRFDALTYHLTLPRIYLEQGRVAYVPELMYWGFPQLAHMWVTWAGALGNAHGALLGWGAGLLACAGMLGHFAQRVGARAAWVALAALLSGSSLVVALSSGYVDWPNLLMGWGVLLFLDLWLSTRQTRWALWAGVFCGLAFGVKYTAGVLAPLGALVFLLLGGWDWRAAARYLGAAFALALPWLVRNWLATGNPFYPLLLPGGEMDALRLSYYQGFAAQGGWLDALLLPWRSTWLGIEGGHIGSAPGYETSLGPLLLLFGLLVLLPGRENKTGRGLKRAAAMLALGGMAVWAAGGMLTGHLIRTHLYFGLFPAFAALDAFGFAAAERVKAGGLRAGSLAAAAACLALGLSALQAALGLADSAALELWSGRSSEQEFSERNLGMYALAIDTLPADGRTLMLWETRGYACAPSCDADEVIDRWQHDLAVRGSPQAVLDAWRAAGFDYVLYYRLGAQFVYADPEHFHSFDLPELEATLSGLRVVRDYEDSYLLYALQP